MIRIALIGQPNCGKSTLFNQVSGYKAVCANFPGTTVECTSSKVNLEGETFELIDFPGIYSLTAETEEDKVTRKNLIALNPSVIIHVVDSSMLSRSLELTLELMELNFPCVLCLNMIDEAQRKGIEIDTKSLSEKLGIPVVETIGIRGQGVMELFKTALETSIKQVKCNKIPLSLDIEKSVEELSSLIGNNEEKITGFPRRFISLKILEQDNEIEKAIIEMKPEISDAIIKHRDDIEKTHGRPSDVVLSSERHALAMNLFESVTKVLPSRKKLLRDRIDSLVLHYFWGYVILGIVLLTFFLFVFEAGKLMEEPIIGIFDRLLKSIDKSFPEKSIIESTITGIIQGFSAGVGIVLPYLIPFLICLSILEDIGYIPRAAFLMDALMHKIGLHGKAVIPFVLGYGCSVPAIISVKTMESKKERFATTLLLNFVPCAARTTIIFGIVAFFIGPVFAALLYICDIILIAVAGKILKSISKEPEPGLILEIPTYKIPNAGTIIKKTWMRLREFVVIAWPLLITGSAILSITEHFHLNETINKILSPFTSFLLGLPPSTGITLIFGILRKELSLVMLTQALGTNHLDTVLTFAQMLTFTVFVMLYTPCIATLAMMKKVVGTKQALLIMLISIIVATVIAISTRFFVSLSSGG